MKNLKYNLSIQFPENTNNATVIISNKGNIISSSLKKLDINHVGEFINEFSDVKFWEQTIANKQSVFKIQHNPEYHFNNPNTYLINLFAPDQLQEIIILTISEYDLHKSSDDKQKAESLNIMRILVDITQFLLGYDQNRDSFKKAMEMLGSGVNADRMYYFENHWDEESKTEVCSMRYEWTRPDVSEQIDNPMLQSIPLEKYLPRLYNLLSTGGILNSHISNLYPEEKPAFENQDIQSVLLIPIIIKNNFKGFIGFDACREPRTWSDHEISLLKITANTLGLFIERQESFESLKNLVLEKETLLSELHHRTKNNLAIISGIIDLQQMSYTEISIEQYSENIRQRIQNIAIIHEILSTKGNISRMSIKQYLETLILRLENSSHYPSKINNIIMIDDFHFSDISQMVSVGILLNEICINSFKYAYINHPNPELKITITRNQEHVKIIVQDNGPGIPEELLNRQFENKIGFKIIRGLASQLRAQLTFENHNGMKTTITIPSLHIID